MRTKTRPQLSEASIEEWRRTADGLVEEIRNWVEKTPGWISTLYPNEERQQTVGLFQVPVLEIQTPDGELKLEPVPRDVDDRPPRASFSSWPTLRRVMLIKRSGSSDWEIMTDSGIPLRQTWNYDTFKTLADDLLAEL